LAIPATDAAENLLECPSVQLFLDRAQAVRPDFQITETNTEAMVRLCRHLEGIPLAIELAAAQAKVLTPSQVLGQLRGDSIFWSAGGATLSNVTALCGQRLIGVTSSSRPNCSGFLPDYPFFRGGWEIAAAETVAKNPTRQNIDETAGKFVCGCRRTRRNDALSDAGNGA
jgi:hypothetical protein